MDHVKSGSVANRRQMCLSDTHIGSLGRPSVSFSQWVQNEGEEAEGEAGGECFRLKSI